jgi:hypothetical protein
VRVPRTDCPDDGILQIDVPWAREEADFTFLFESFAMTLVREMPACLCRVSTADRSIRCLQIIDADDNRLLEDDAALYKAVRQKEDYSGVKQVWVDEISRGKGHGHVSLFVDTGKRRTFL